MKKDASPLLKEAYAKNAELHGILSSPKRLEILNAIKRSPMSVTELAEMLHVAKANVAQHLALLRYAHVVACERKGKRVFYSLVNEKFTDPIKILETLLKD